MDENGSVIMRSDLEDQLDAMPDLHPVISLPYSYIESVENNVDIINRSIKRFDISQFTEEMAAQVLELLAELSIKIRKHYIT